MKKFFTWLHILLKRQFKNPFLIVMLVLIPVTAFIISLVPEKEKESGYIAGLYVEGTSEDDFAGEIVDNLVAGHDSIRFVRFDDLESMRKSVTTEDIICGYVIPADIKYKLSSEEDAKGCITSYILPASSLQPAINELVYAELIRLYGYYLMDNYMSTSDIFPKGDYTSEAFKYYEKYLASDETIHIIYEEYGTGRKIESDIKNASFTFPVRGILSILVFLSGMYGCVLFLKDNENGIFQTITGNMRTMVRFMYIMIPTVLFGICEVLTIFISGNAAAPGKELCGMLIYIILITVFCFILISVVRKSKILSACISVILLCSLVFCPVFINADIYIPAIKYVQKLFMPYYYLKFFM